ncbi:hypothetical protein GKE82_18915 [Conexibacter sp. W3-3-2]|uniref:hypothetical protein n=1 Tax=Conexibacter sp. W3-3-2 TaxID=2675227 RepID=UPI0012B95559|nr:hypothetical protein [Conexibacter sp. W3-3-2]MTD46300.1 hypothetical protein [Conexibacter sp. W3-3-2]
MTDGSREIERAWELDRSGGTRPAPWESYGWLLDAAHRLEQDEISILVSSYRVFHRIGQGLGSAEARALFEVPHRYAFGGVVVHGVSWRGGWRVRGPVLVVGGDTARLTAVEDAGAPAVAVVTDDPAALGLWRYVYEPLSLGAARTPVEPPTEALSDLAAAALRAATDAVNPRRAVLEPAQVRTLAGALVALRNEEFPVPPRDLATFLLSLGWSARLALQGAEIGHRVWSGQTPRHDVWRFGRDSAVR